MDMSDTKYFLGVVFALLVTAGIVFFVLRRYLKSRADRKARRKAGAGTGGAYTPPPRHPPRHPPDAKP